MCIICLQCVDTSVCKRRRDSDGSRDGQPFLRDKYYLLHFDFHGKQKRRKQEGTMAKNDYTQKQTNKNNSENTQKNQSKNSTKESTSDCKDKNNQ